MVADVGTRTAVYGVVGDPVEHSLSPALHNAAFQAAGLDCVYVAFRVSPAQIGEAVAGARALGLRGLSVTIPHKSSILAHLDEVDELARWVGSVNTVVNRGGRLIGYTSDGHGALEAFRAAGETTAGRKVVVLGTGGAARAIAFAICRDATPASLELLGIEDAQRDALVADLSARTGARVAGGRLDRLESVLRNADVLIQTTPVGMHPARDGTLVPAELLRADLVVFDAVYNPLCTRLLAEAARAGSRTIPGLGMFVHQAAVQFRLWTGVEPPLDVMERVVRSRLGEPPRSH